MLSTREFQISLLVGLLKDEEIFHRLIGILRPTDFDFQPCRFLYECIIGYFRKYNRQVGIKSDLGHLIFNSIDGNNPDISELLMEEEKPALAEIIKEILDAEPMSPEYFKENLINFLNEVRTIKALEENEGDTRNLVSSVTDISNELSELEVFDDEFDNPCEEIDFSMKEYVPLGISSVDASLSGGPNRGEYGMIIAGSGIGKTNALLNFGIGGCSTGYRVLLVNLELPLSSIRTRWQAMNAMLNPELFEIDFSEWPVKALNRYRQVVENKNEIANRLTVYDNSTRRVAMNNTKLNQVIENWMKNIKRNYGEDPNDVCGLVLIDQFSYMDTAIYERRTDTNVNPQLRVCQEFAKTAKNHNVTLWVPEQINDAGLGKTVLTAKHIAFGRNKQDETDLFFGVAPCIEEMGTSDLDLLHGIKSSKTNFTGRYLNLSKIKVRNKQVPWVSLKVWQSETLRLYASKKIAQSVETDLPTFHDVIKKGNKK